MASSGIDIQSGDIFDVTLTYDGSNLTESITDTSTKANFTHTYTGINLPSIFGANTAFVGFGGGTGAATMSLFVNSWTYTVDTRPYSDRDADCHLDWRNCDHNGCDANRDWRNCDRNGFDATRDRNCNRNGFAPNRNARRNAYGAGCFDAGANQRLSRGCEPEREIFAATATSCRTCLIIRDSSQVRTRT